MNLTSELDQLKLNIEHLQQKVLALTEDNQRLAGEAEFAGQMIIEPVLSSETDVKADQVKQLESQLLMASEENEKLHRAMADLKSGRCHSGIVESDDGWKEAPLIKEEDLHNIEEQHATELKVLEYRLQESYKSQVSKLRSEVEAEVKSVYDQQVETMENEYRIKTEQYRKEMEQKFLEEMRKVSGFDDCLNLVQPALLLLLLLCLHARCACVWLRWNLCQFSKHFSGISCIMSGKICSKDSNFWLNNSKMKRASIVLLNKLRLHQALSKRKDILLQCIIEAFTNARK
jgi:hypothetical protein